MRPHAEDAVRRAKEDFKDHVLIKEGDGRYYWGRPGTGTYHMRIVESKNAIFVHGDVGNLALETSERSGIAWLRGVLANVDSISWDYVAQKVRLAGGEAGIYKHSIAAAREWVQETIDQVKENEDKDVDLEELVELLSDEDILGARDLLYDRMSHIVGEYMDDPPSLKVLTWHFHFQVAALALFIAAEAKIEDNPPQTEPTDA